MPLNSTSVAPYRSVHATLAARADVLRDAQNHP